MIKQLGISAIFLSAFSFVLCTTSAASAKDNNSNGKAVIKNLNAPGNLAVTHNLDCIPLVNIKNQYTPADLYRAAAKCIRQEQFAEANELFLTAGVYGYFDRLRVTDLTAHQGLKVLILQNISTLSIESREKWAANFEPAIKRGSPFLARSCASIRNLGPPDYYPSYMIQHGIRAFIKDKSEPALEESFDKNMAWEKSMESYLHCSN